MFRPSFSALDLLAERNILLAHSVMAKDTLITTVDSHTAGEPTRVITEGLPPIPGDTIGQQMAYFRENLDHIRTALLHEPRGDRHLVGAVVLPSNRPDADFGAFYLDHSRCFSMCGHASVGIGVTLAKTGRIEIVEPETKVVLDTPAGLVTIRLAIEDGRAVSGTLTNVPCFLHTKDILVGFEDQSLSVDMAFGGSFFVVVRAEDLGVEIRPDNISELARYSSLIAREVSKTMTPTHPEVDGPGYESLVYFHGDARGSSADFRSLAVGGSGNFDRSPCGTGTSARLAVLFARGELGPGDSLRVESVIGTSFEAKIAEVCKVGDFPAIVPEITTSAFVTGYHQFLIDPDDPLKDGFLL